MKKGMTLIEVVIVLGIILVVLPLIFGLFFINLQAQSKIFILGEVKKNGDFAMSVMQNVIRNNAHAIYSDVNLTTEVCSAKYSTNTPTSSNTVYFADRYKKLFYFSTLSGKIASRSAAMDYFLTNTKVTPSSLAITCSRTSLVSPPIVSVSFTVSDSSGVRHEEKASMNFKTKIKLRSY